MPKIMFRSTNRNAPLASFKEALMKGQSPDYGLYMPVEIPKLGKEFFESLKDKPYWELAYGIIKQFVDEIPAEKLKELVKDAYNFDVPVKKINDRLYLMYLDNGPTASFKDFAAMLMARLMGYFAKKENKKLTVLVATSGDTGGAVANAFYGLDGINVVVLFPEKQISEMQRKQMSTLGKNVRAFAVQGTFDDCQAIVKRAFNDPELKELNLTSANSINFGRLLPQACYYAYAYLKANNDAFCVPSGNFGDLMGGILAREMGLPIKKFIVAVNENDEFPDFLKTGVYNPVVPSKNCSSSAMNVGHPSNLARLVDLYGGWITDERNEKGEVVMKGVMKQKPDMGLMRKDLISFSISNKEVDETIKEFYGKHKIIIEPHGAVGIAAWKKANLQGITVCLETAHPAKFPEKIKEILGIEPEMPECLKKLADKEEKYETVSNSYEEFKKKIKN